MAKLKADIREKEAAAARLLEAMNAKQQAALTAGAPQHAVPATQTQPIEDTAKRADPPRERASTASTGARAEASSHEQARQTQAGPRRAAKQVALREPGGVVGWMLRQLPRPWKG